MSEQTATNPPPPKRRWISIVGIVAVLLIALIVAAPWIVARTGLRDTAINTILASPSVTASTESASLGWISPLSVHGMDLTSTNKRVNVHVDDIKTEQSPWQLWSSAPDLGTIRVDKPHIRLELPLDIEIKGKDRKLEPTFIAIVKDGALTVKLAGEDAPVLDVDAIDMTFRVEKTEDGRVLTLDPLVVFDKRKLSPKLVSGLLHLFDPTIENSPEVSGEISFSLDKLRIPLGVPKEEAVKRMEVEGKLVLHNVSGEIKNPMRKALVQVVADLNGKQPSEVVRLVEDAEIRFQVRDGRLHHEGLRIGFPDIDPALQITSRGSVGLDKSLDLFVELPRLDKSVRKDRGPAKCRITGTVSNPKIKVDDASLVLRQPGRKDPLIAVDDIDLDMKVETTAAGPVLVFAPMQVFKKAKLNVATAKGLVGLIAPLVQTEREVAGEISLELATVRVPLGVSNDQRVKGLEAEGKLTLHHVATEVKTPMMQAVIKLLADMNGKQPPKVANLVDDAEIKFQVRDGRLHHEGLRIGLPEIDPKLVVSSSGSIGMDETLDLHLEFPRLRKGVQDKGPIKAHVTGTISEPKVAVPGAALVVQLTGDDKATLTVDNIDLNLGVEKTKDGPVLTVAPVKIFDKKKLTPEVGDELLKLIAPTLADLSGVQGEISLSFEKFRVPLGVSKSEAIKGVELEGKLQLHQISVSAKTPLVQTFVKVLADMHGKNPTDVVRVVENADVQFKVSKGRMYHEGLRLGFPDISPDLVITSSGYVGFDRSLDLVVEVPRILLKKKDPPVTKTPAPVRFQVTGTIEKPVVMEMKEKANK